MVWSGERPEASTLKVPGYWEMLRAAVELGVVRSRLGDTGSDLMLTLGLVFTVRVVP